MRCFIAIDFSEEIKNKIALIQADLKKSGADVKWVNPQLIHLTLSFFKNLRPEDVDLISEKIKEGGMTQGAFELTLQGLGNFPPTGDPRVIWIGIQSSLKLTVLYRRIQKIAQPFDEEDLKTEHEEPYVPHVTIGRVRSRKNIQRIKQMIKEYPNDLVGASQVSELIFFESRLSQKGPEYFQLHRFTL